MLPYSMLCVLGSMFKGVFFRLYIPVPCSLQGITTALEDRFGVGMRESIEKEPAADVGSSGATADVVSARPAANVGSTGPTADVGLAGPAADVGSSDVLVGTKVKVGCPLHPSFELLKNVQKISLKAIRAIGFGSMEFLKVTQLPLQLGLWLVHHFDANTCSLNIPDFEPFCITEEHVHQVLGLPMGGIEIDKNNFSRDKRVIQQWKKQFKSNSLSIKIGELKEFLKEHNSDGLMFKRNFVVLCVSTLMDGKQNVNINSGILTFLSDVDKIKDLNWCKYILDSLVKAKLFWEERQTGSFS
uniref:Uncharacterized protein n=1 Tax=Chenopodium quinoa TaxID=63459 RepID=A0A803N0G5_CHEQI